MKGQVVGVGKATRDFSTWVDLGYDYDGSAPLSLLHLALGAKVYESLAGACQTMTLFMAAEDGRAIQGGLWIDARGTTLVDVDIDLSEDQDSGGYAGVRQACRSGQAVISVRPAPERHIIDIPLIAGGRLMASLGLECQEAPSEVLADLQQAGMPLLLAGVLRYAESVRNGFLERRSLLCSVNIHQQYQSDLTGDHILQAVCFHIQKALELDRCLILGTTARGHRRFCSGLQYAEEVPRSMASDAGQEAWPTWAEVAEKADAQFEEKIEGTVVMFPLRAAGGRPAVVVFDNSISQTRFRDRDMVQLALVRDALAVLWTLTEDLEAQRSANSRDTLTGSFNRAYGFRYIREWLGHVRQGSDMVALFFVDVDRFKAVNDNQGHLMGDRVLAALVAHLEEAVGRHGVVIRYGGEEFLVACPEMNRAAAERLAERLVRIATWPPDVSPVSISVGVAMGPWHGTSAEVLIERADQAMYQVKRRGGNDWCMAVFQPDGEIQSG